MKVLITGPALATKYIEMLRIMGFSVINGTIEALKVLGIDASQQPRELSQDELSTLLADADAYIYGGLEAASEEALNITKCLKIIAFLGTGWADDGCVDPVAVTRRGIAVTNTPGANAASVAEITMGLIITLQRQIVELNRVTKKGHGHPVRLRDIRGRRLGIVGLGAIGGRVAEHARHGFDMDVVYAGPHHKPEIEKRLQIKKVELDELLSASDFVSLHCPAVSTRGLIGHRELCLIKCDSYLINVASPEIVDGESLVKALAEDRIAGVAFDGYYKDPERLRDEFLSLPDSKLIVLPRVAWLTDDSYARMADMAITNIKQFLAGQDPPNLVNPQYKIARQ